MGDSVETLAVDMRYMKVALDNISITMRGVNDTLQEMSKLAASHESVLEQLKNGSITMSDHSKRIGEIEKQMPPLLEMRKWVIGGILTGVSMMGVALLKLVIVDPLRGPVSMAQNQPQIVYVTPQPQKADKQNGN